MFSGNEAYEELAVGLVHEVKNPLQLVSANLDILEMDETESQRAERYNAIRRELSRVTELLNAFIGGVGSEPTRILEIGDIVDRAVEPFTIAHEEICFLRTYGAAGVFVEAREQELLMLLGNLVKNAVEAVGPGGIVRISYEKTETEAIITVWDNGPGLPELILKAITKKRVTTKTGGTGTGLSLCRHIVERLGGKLDFRNRNGCHAEVTLPLKEVNK